MKNLRHNLATFWLRLQPHRGSILYSGSYIFQLAGRTLAEIFAAYQLGPLIYGVWKIWQLFITLGTISFGISNGAGKLIPMQIGQDNLERARQYQDTTLSCTVLAALLMTCACWFFLQRDAEIQAPDYPVASLMIFLVLIFFENLNRSVLVVLRSYRCFSTLVGIQFATGMVYFLTILLIWKFAYLGLVSGFAAASLGSFLLGLLSLPSYPRSFQCSSELSKSLLLHGFPLMMMGYGDALLSSLDRILLKTWIGTEAVGKYALAMLVYGVIMILPLTLAQYFYPSVAMEFSREPFGRRCREALAQQQYLSKIALAMLLTILALALYPAVQYLLPKYKPGLVSTYILMLGLFPLGLMQGYISLFIMSDRIKKLILLQIIALLFNAVVSSGLLLIFHCIEVVAISSALTFSLQAWVLKRESEKLWLD